MKATTKRRIIYDLSISAILKVLLVLAVFLLLFKLQGIVVSVFVAILIAAGIEPVVAGLNKRFPISRGAWALIIYILILAALGLVVFLIVPPLAIQIANLASLLPGLLAGAEPIQDFIGNAQVVENLREVLINFSDQLAQSATSVLLTIQRLFGSLLAAFTIFILSFYMVVEENSIQRVVDEMVPKRQREKTMRLVNRIKHRLGAWVRGQLLLGIIIGVLTYIGLTVLGVPFALVLAIIAALLELIPYLGPIIAAVPAVIIASGIPDNGFTIAVLVVILYAIVQQLENQVIVPRVMARAVGLSPVVIIVALLSGFELFGVLGAILAVPVTAVLSILIKHYFSVKEPKKKAAS